MNAVKDRKSLEDLKKQEVSNEIEELFEFVIEFEKFNKINREKEAIKNER
jgi:hypothetical protein